MRTILAALIAAVSVVAEEIYEPMYSFSSPFILESGKLPYWENAGATVITEDFVRLVPAMQSKQGSVWAETVFSNLTLALQVSRLARGR